MPEWMHQRAEHILAKNPSMPKSEAFAIATQQMHSLGKSPKSYGTKGGRETAKAKYDTPKDDVKAANPGNLESSKMASGFTAEYDAGGNLIGRKSREEELARLLAGSFGFAKKAIDHRLLAAAPGGATPEEVAAGAPMPDTVLDKLVKEKADRRAILAAGGPGTCAGIVPPEVSVKLRKLSSATYVAFRDELQQQLSGKTLWPT